MLLQLNVTTRVYCPIYLGSFSTGHILVDRSLASLPCIKRVSSHCDDEWLCSLDMLIEGIFFWTLPNSHDQVHPRLGRRRQRHWEGCHRCENTSPLCTDLLTSSELSISLIHRFTSQDDRTKSHCY